MIIYEKLINMYSLKKIKDIIGEYEYYYYFSKNNNSIRLEKITQKINLKDIYSYKDFLKDFGVKFSKIKEKATLYNFLMNGISVSDFLKSDANIYKQLCDHFYMESKTFSKEQIQYIAIEYDISNFEVAFFDKHIELYGEKDDLEAFKKKFKISQKVLWNFQNNTWHLAFKGLLAEKIRWDYKKDSESL